MSAINKVDMSLDDIIKLNRKVNRNNRGKGIKNRGKGNKVKETTHHGGTTRGRGRGRGNSQGGTTRGRGRGRASSQVGFGSASVTKLRKFRTNLQRGGRKTRGQAKRHTLGQASTFTSSAGLRKKTYKSSGGSGRGTYNQFTASTRAFRNQSLKQRRDQALSALRKAKQQLSRINSQSVNRENVVNQRRGLQTPSRGHSRGQARGGRTRSGHGASKMSNMLSYNMANTVNFNPLQKGRARLPRLNMDYISSNTQVLTTTGPKQKKARRRGWRSHPNGSIQAPSAANDNIMTISLPNTSYKPPVRQTRKKESPNFSYNEKLFAYSGNNASLSERFNSGQTGTDRHVFL